MTARLLKLFVVMVLLFASGAWAQEVKQQQRAPVKILLLNSWHPDFPWQAAFDRGLKEGLKDAGRAYTLYSEYLDSSRFSSSPQIGKFREYLAAKYNDAGIDVLITEGTPAAQFAVDNPELASSAKRVFSRPGFPVAGKRVPTRNADFPSAIAEMQHVARPQALYVVSDSVSPGQKKRVEAFQAALDAAKLQIPVTYLTDLPMDDVLARVSSLPKNSAIFYLLVFQDGAGRKFVPFNAAKLLASRANAPIFTHWATIMGSGVLGGYQLSGERVGNMVARTVLGGRKVLSADEAFARYYDWDQLQRWGIPLARIGEDAVILNQPDDVFEKHKWEIIILLTVMVVLTIMSVVLVVVNHQRKRMTRALKRERNLLEDRVEERTEELEQSQQRYRNLIDGLHEHIVFMTDKEGKLTYVSNSLTQILGYGVDEFVKNGWASYVTDAQGNQEAFSHIEAALRGDIPPTFTLEFFHKSGAKRLLEITERPRLDEAGNLVGIEGIAQDVTEQSQYEAQLVEARKSAETANRAKSQFLANMSHEIRTPMNGVVGMLDVLSHSRLAADDQKMVETIRQSAFSLLGIINDILDFSKIEAGKFGLSLSEMCLEDEFDSVVNLLDRVALEKNVELTMYFDPEIPRTVTGDALRLRQILTNLTGNALKFSSGREQLGRVHLRAELERREADQAWVRLSVQDNGIGIDKRTRDRLFQAFEQADTETTRTYGGTGLGLVISEKLAELMGGAIHVESEVGVGSTFSMSLPFAFVSTDERDPLESDLTDVEAVVVGDDPRFVGDYGRYLRHAGANVYSVEEMEAAWDLIRERSLIEPICMLVMGAPGLKSAQEVVERLLEEQPEKDVRLIVQLAYLSVEKGKRRTVRTLTDNVFQIDREVLPRRRLLDAVAFSVGRVPAGTLEPEDVEFEEHPILQSREDAVANGRLVLVAEDNITNQEVIRRQLNLLGFTGDLCGDGVEALEKWKTGEYGLLLTDLHMPNMDGYDLTFEVRQQEQKHHKDRTPIVALTANALKGEEERCLEIGMDGYISKPVELDHLKAILDSWLPPQDGASKPSCGDTTELLTKEETEHADDSKAVDPEMLARMVGDDLELQVELIGDFLKTTDSLLRKLDELYAKQDAEAYGALAHRLKSSVRSFGANPLGALFADLEKAGKSGDWTTIEKHHEEIRPAFLAVKSHYDKTPEIAT